VEPGVQNYVVTERSFRSIEPHVLIPLADIEKLVRLVPLDANGLPHIEVRWCSLEARVSLFGGKLCPQPR
jgi:hypothetical protein